MEIFLNLWDELDDLIGACRHIATSAVIEFVSLSRPLAGLLSTTLAAAMVWFSRSVV
jgi:hypothetical protein